MALTYYVALPFIRSEDGIAPGEAQECQSEGAAIRRAEGMSRNPANVGAIAMLAREAAMTLAVLQAIGFLLVHRSVMHFPTQLGSPIHRGC